MLRGLFVTGTDTGVGKTVTSAALMIRYRPQGPIRYWKPVQTGIESDDDTAEVERLADCAADEILNSGVRLHDPVSPHLAAQRHGSRIDLGALLDRLPGDAPRWTWIVEGAGGVLVPLNERELMVDLMRRLGLPVVVAARSALGTINHTLLTVEALRRRDLPVAGVVMVGDADDDNRAAIEQYGRVRVVGCLPRLAPLTAGRLAAWASTALDPDGGLLEHMR